jgi:hypothetical protein
MFDVLGVGQWYAIFCSEPGAAWMTHLNHQIGSLPAGGELGPPFVFQHTLEHDATNRECPLADEPLVAAP